MSETSFFVDQASHAVARMRERVEFFSMSDQCAPAAATTLLRELDDLSAAISTLATVLARPIAGADEVSEDAEVRPPIGN